MSDQDCLSASLKKDSRIYVVLMSLPQSRLPLVDPVQLVGTDFLERMNQDDCGHRRAGKLIMCYVSKKRGYNKDLHTEQWDIWAPFPTRLININRENLTHVPITQASQEIGGVEGIPRWLRGNVREQDLGSIRSWLAQRSRGLQKCVPEEHERESAWYVLTKFSEKT